MKYRVLVGFLLCGSLLHAGNVDDLKKSCDRARAPIGANNKLHWTEECIEQIFSLDIIHPTVKTIAPGTGPAFGVGTGHIWRRDKIEYLPSLYAVGSTDGSVAVRGDFTIALPPISFGRIPDQSSSDTPDEQGSSGGSQQAPSTLAPVRPGRVGLVVDSIDIDAKASINFHTYWFNATHQDFYGQGPFSTDTLKALYGRQQLGIGVALNDPITSWAQIGLRLDYLRPRIISVSNSSTPSIYQAFTPADLPGLGVQTEFMRYEPYAQAHIRFRGSSRWKFLDLRVGDAFYQNLNGSQFSFQRLGARSRLEYEILLPSEGTASHRTKLRQFLCPATRGARHCSAGTLDAVGLVNVAYTGTGSSVPFYLDETLGGADIYGNDTLRGYVDYRFQAPSRMLLQGEYRHGIWGPLGFLGFYDVGRVAFRPSDLSFEHLRHDFGVGFTVSANKIVVFRAYVGFGTGEGIRPNAKFGSVY